MKKVKDYFKLPVTGQQIVEQYSGDITWFKATEEDEAIAHAINHVDALAENLSAMVSMFDRLCEANDFDADRQAEYVDAKAALAA